MSDQRHGIGKYTWVDGNMYEGQYEYGEIKGNGKFTWSDGRYYEGSFKNDK